MFLKSLYNLWADFAIADAAFSIFRLKFCNRALREVFVCFGFFPKSIDFFRKIVYYIIYVILFLKFQRSF